MKVYPVSMTEIQEDSTYCTTDAFGSWDEAELNARKFMKRCIHDFYELDSKEGVADPEAEADRILGSLLFAETNRLDGRATLNLTYEVPDLVLCTCVKEVDV